MADGPFTLMAGMNALRAGSFDLFGRTEERRMEHQALAIEHASILEHIPCYGPIKARHVARTKVRAADTRCRWNSY